MGCTIIKKLQYDHTKNPMGNAVSVYVHGTLRQPGVFAGQIVSVGPPSLPSGTPGGGHFRRGR